MGHTSVIALVARDLWQRKQTLSPGEAPITVIPHPPWLVVGRDYEGDLTSAAWPLGVAFALYEELCYCTFTHLCSTDLMKEPDCPCRRELDNCPFQIPYYVPPSTNLGGWGIAVIAA